MKQICSWASLFILLVFAGCKEKTELINANSIHPLGKVSLAIAEVPYNILSVKATMSRSGYTDLQITLSVNDSGFTATGAFEDVPIGIWTLVVEASDSAGVIRYRGETSVNVVSSDITLVDLELLPTAGTINIVVHWGSSGVFVPDNTKWEWTRDGRGGGSQSSIIPITGGVEILPAEHVHFVNRTVNQGKATYTFKFLGSHFKFAWRISPTDSFNGRAITFEGSSGNVILVHVIWNTYYFGYHNGSYFLNRYTIPFDDSTWHDVKISDTGNDLKIDFDGTQINLFEGQHSVQEFLSDLTPGYIGIGHAAPTNLFYKNIQVDVR
jgi:hypothetical protein